MNNAPREWDWIHDLADQLDSLDRYDLKKVLHGLADTLNDKEHPLQSEAE